MPIRSQYNVSLFVQMPKMVGDVNLFEMISLSELLLIFAKHVLHGGRRAVSLASLIRSNAR